MPGNDDRIDSYVNLNAIGKETKAFKAQLNEIYTQLKQINATKITLNDPSSSFKDKAAVAARLGEEQKKLNLIVEQSAKLQRLEAAALKESYNAEAAKDRAAQQLEKTKQQQLKTEKLVIDAIVKEEKENERATASIQKKAAAQEKANQAALATAAKNPKVISVTNLGNGDTNSNATGPAVSSNDVANGNEANAATAAGVNRYTEVVKKKNKAVEEGAAATKKSKEELAAEARQLEINKQLEQQAALNLKNSVKEQLAAKGSLDQRSAALLRLKKVFSSLNDEERKTPYGQRLGKIIEGLDVQVKTLDKDIGNSQRNVGNYMSAFAGGARKAFGALRLIANILPGIGIAGLLGFAVSPIIDFVEKIYKSINAVKLLRQEIKESLNTANGAGAGDIAKQSSQLDAYVKIAKSDVYTKKEQAQAIEAINKLIPNSIGVITKQNIATAEGTKILSAYTDQLLKRSKVEVYSSEIGKLETKRFEARSKLIDQLNKEFLQEKISSQTSGGLDAEGHAAFENRRKGYANEYAKTAGVIIKEQKKLSKVVLDNTVGVVPDDKKTGAQGEKLRAIQKKFFEDQLKDEMAFNLQLSKNEDFALKARLELRKTAFEIEQQLADEQRKTELDNESDKLNTVLSQKSSKNAIINAQAEYRQRVLEINEKYNYADVKAVQNNENDILAIKASANARKKELDKKYNEEAAEQFKADAAARLQRMIDDAERTRELAVASQNEARDLRLKQLAIDEKTELSKVTNPEKRQLIEEKYNRLRVKRELEASRDLLKIQQKYAESQIKIAQAQLAVSNDPQERKVLENRIAVAQAGLAEIKRQMAELDNSLIDIKINIDTAKFQEKAQEIERILKKIEKAFGQTFEAIGGIIDIGVEKEKNAIAEEQRATDLANQREIDTVNQSLATEEEKAARIYQINQRQEEQRRVYEERTRVAEERRLKFEKASNIAKIAIETALAVVHQLGSGDPITAIPRAIAVGVLGAVRLATAIATPIPKYGDGTGDGLHPGGLAWLGDKYKKERVRLPSGKEFDSASTPTLYNLEKGTQVFPDADKVDNAIMNMSMQEMAKMQIVNEKSMLDEMIKASNRGNKQIVGAIKGKVTTVVNNTWSGPQISFKNASGWHERVQRMTQTKSR